MIDGLLSRQCIAPSRVPPPFPQVGIFVVGTVGRVGLSSFYFQLALPAVLLRLRLFCPPRLMNPLFSFGKNVISTTQEHFELVFSLPFDHV